MNDAGRIGFVVRGEYDSSATYDFLDVVLFGNSSYAAKKLTIGNTPAENSEYWQMLAKAPEAEIVSKMETVTYSHFAEIPASNGEFFSCIVNYEGADGNAPDISSALWWWNVIQFGVETQLTQIAYSPLRRQNSIFIRQKHDDSWNGWYVINPYEGINVQKPTFEQADNRTNLTSGETVSSIFGKIMKWFADLKSVAFSGSYKDLSDKPKYVSALNFSGTKYTVSYSDGTHTDGEIKVPPATVFGTLTRVAGNSEIYYYVTINGTLSTEKEYEVVRSSSYTTQILNYKGEVVKNGIYIGERIENAYLVISNGYTTKTVIIDNYYSKEFWIPRYFTFTYNGSSVTVADISF